jgi:glutathione synthase/RimK-type ligase-like ATP-grasp enzyme
MNNKVALLSMDSLAGFECYDHLLIDPMARLGWQASEISWRDPDVRWDDFHTVIIRSPWDYQQEPEAFLQVLQTIENSRARLENPLSIVRWNVVKTYLRDISSKGVNIVPTVWLEQWDPDSVRDCFRRWQTDELVVKPWVSANANHTHRLSESDLAEQEAFLSDEFARRPFMVQPFVPSVVAKGEYSLFYFAGEFSHAILKTPAPDDFRVQEEHGGRLTLIEPSEHLLEVGRRALEAIGQDLLYARADFVVYDEAYCLMELELIEPSLYFNMDPESPERFARLFDRWARARA